MAEEIKNTTEEQWASVDKLVGELMHEPYIIPNLAHMSEEEGIKQVKYSKATDVPLSTTGDKFDYDILNVPSRIWNYKPIVRKTIPILLDHQENDLSAKLGVQSLLVQEELEANKQMFDYIQKIVFHGDPLAVPGSEGMANFTGISAGAAAAVWTTAGNFFADLETAISSLRSNRILPPYSLVMTPGIHAELRSSNLAAAGNYTNEWKTFIDIYMNFVDNREVPIVIGELFITDAIATDASGDPVDLATDTQTFLLFKNDPTVGYVAESETIGRKDIPSKKFEQDIAYAKIWGGCWIPKLADGYYLVYGGTTTTAY